MSFPLFQQMLPPEILFSPGAADKTMESLFSGELVRFGSHPLKSFFNELNQGGFDPEVVKMKIGIKKHWRRDMLRRKKIYHTKLLQEVIISSEKCLKQFDPPQKAFEFLNPNQVISKPVKSIKSNKVKATTPNSTKNKNTLKSSASPRPKVVKRLHEEIISRKEPFSFSLSSSDEESPGKKLVIEVIIVNYY